ncbi:hypothetical protein ACRAWD_18490 [Caulobacter segnis]
MPTAGPSPRPAAPNTPTCCPALNLRLKAEAERVRALRGVREHRPARLQPAGPVDVGVGHPAIAARRRGRRHHQPADRGRLYPGRAEHGGGLGLGGPVPTPMSPSGSSAAIRTSSRCGPIRSTCRASGTSTAA